MGFLNNLLKNKVGDYVNLQIKVLKLNITNSISKLIGSIIFSILCLVFLLFILVFAGLGVVELLVDTGLSRSGAVFSTMGGYALFLILLLAFRSSIIKFFSGFFIAILTSGEDANKK